MGRATYINGVLFAAAAFALACAYLPAHAEEGSSAAASAAAADTALPVPETPAGGAVLSPSDAPASLKAAPVKSLIFLPEEMALIRRSLAAYGAHNDGGATPHGEKDETDFLRQLSDAPQQAQAGGDQQAQTYTYPQFYLDSLVYHTPDNWGVWVNGQKTTTEFPASGYGLRILSVDEDKVSFEWRPLDFNRIHSVPDTLEQAIHVNRASNTVSFTLHPNQTFSSYAMRVLEGRVQPVTVSNGDDAAALPADAPAADMVAPALPPLSPPPAPRVSKGAGLGGLLDRYQQLKKEPDQ